MLATVAAGGSSEPLRFQAEAHRIQKEMVAAAAAHYPVFVAAYECTSHVAQRLGNSQHLVAAAIDDLAHMRQHGQALVAQGAEWRKERQKTAAALATHARISELLEASQTLEACVRNDMFHEAMLLLEHVRSLAAAHPDVPLLQMVDRDLTEAAQRLVASVVMPRLASLQAPLPTAMRMVTFIKQLGAEEATLRILFLALRTDFIDSLLQEADALAATSAAAHLCRCINIFKVHVTDVVTTYTACFASDDAAGDAALGDWTALRCRTMVQLVRQQLKAVTSGGDLAQVADQVRHFAAPASKIGLDCTSILSELVVDRAVEMYSGSVQAALQSFEVALVNHQWKTVPRATPSTSSGAAAAESSAAAASPSSSVNLTAPPLILLQLLPLAYLLNGVISGVNELRKCALLAAFPAVRRITVGLIKQVTESARQAAVDRCLEGEEIRAHQDFMNIMFDDCFAYIAAAVDAVYQSEDTRAAVRDCLHPGA